MNAYDFDKTIYHYDSTVTFYLWCLMRYPRIMLRWPQLIVSAISYKCGKLTKHAFMERFWAYLHDVKDVRGEVGRFWDKHMQHMHSWYQKTRREDDLLISASPDFLVRPAAQRLGIRHILASPLNPDTGLYEGMRCSGKEKVAYLRAAYPDAQIEAFYSDSMSDAPMAAISERAYMVRGEKYENWPPTKGK